MRPVLSQFVPFLLKYRGAKMNCQAKNIKKYLYIVKRLINEKGRWNAPGLFLFFGRKLVQKLLATS
jgi:hypothetical protein